MTELPLWRIRTVDVTGSTNADMAALARTGEPEGAVLIAGQQTAGRGRLGRHWESPRGTSLSVSLLLRPGDVPAARWPWLPLLTGVAVAGAVRAAAGVDAVLKWPNDVLVASAKLGGILVERVDRSDGAAAVVGIGLNVGQSAAQLPAGATSLGLQGATVTREDVLDAVLRHFRDEYVAWRRAGGDATGGLRAAYRGLCDTVGRDVEALLPGALALRGKAVDVDVDGRLVLEVDGEQVVVSAGEVVHVRSAAEMSRPAGMEWP
jgi:BirA family transcriptional regulator, biotin operon repressor / biotin---[acetyl-CoA-carboxylase] ligase